MGYIFVLYVSLVGSVVEDDAVVVQSIVHPLAQLSLWDDHAGWVVGIAEVYHIYAMVGYLRNKAVALCARHVCNIAPSPVFKYAGASVHHVRVYVDGIDRVCHGHRVIPSHQFADVSGVAFGSVVNEHFTWVEMNASWQIVVLHDGLAQKGVALLRTVAVEGFLVRHLVYRLVHGLYDSRAQWLRNVAYAKAYDVRFGMRGLKGIHLLRNVCE